MIERIKRSDYPFPNREFQLENHYFRFSGVHCHVQIETGITAAMWHVYIDRMTKQLRNEIKSELPGFFALMKSMGMTEVIGIKPIDENIGTWLHFIRMFGITRVVDITHEGIPCKAMIVEV